MQVATYHYDIKRVGDQAEEQGGHGGDGLQVLRISQAAAPPTIALLMPRPNAHTRGCPLHMHVHHHRPQVQHVPSQLQCSVLDDDAPAEGMLPVACAFKVFLIQVRGPRACSRWPARSRSSSSRCVGRGHAPGGLRVQGLPHPGAWAEGMLPVACAFKVFLIQVRGPRACSRWPARSRSSSSRCVGQRAGLRAVPRLKVFLVLCTVPGAALHRREKQAAWSLRRAALARHRVWSPACASLAGLGAALARSCASARSRT